MKRILITGASRGIGKAIAVKMADKEHAVLLHGRDSAALNSVAEDVKAAGADASILTADLSKLDDVAGLIRALGTDPIDVLVNNAGVVVAKPVEELTVEDWQRTLAVNVTAPFILCQKVLPLMPRGGSIVNILSIAARAAFPGWSSYSMSKAAMEGFSRGLREELRDRGIRVITVFPAATATDIWRSVPGDWDTSKMMTAESVADAVAGALRQPEGVSVDEIHIGGVGGNL